ncbi:carbohydrate ABC transporter permease [Aureibacillus halotolerans]|uniref:Carbohydrate ABC transporter membrane protein 1 (CUT1 family) n=1 Tax=Aureibacillus halotolerans TaxID=1508390 RepID=A0A4R6UDH5_9BACI|nr:sugar ABC transporter permease [Aureibacillus halotolerans]TDQ42845.1 carbohydrate ABC transporter membrane protein 1 (CUT1 family) [Aureibacillus halotolerans]
MWKTLRPYAMVAPAVLIFALFFIYPIFYMIYLSFFDWNFVSPTKDFVGVDNFTVLSGDSEFQKVMWNSLFYMLFTVTLTISLSLLLALWLNKKARIYGFIQGAVFSPHIISLVSVAMLWMWLMDTDHGLLNWALGLVGISPVQWLSSPDTALWSLVLVAVWKGVGFNALVFIAGLQSIPKDMYEAAALDESGPVRTFVKITLPMLSPTVFFLTIINMIGSFQVFESIAIMTQGGPINSTNTLVFYIYQYGFRFFKIGYASAAGVILLVLIAILTIVYFKLMERRVHYR